jgi:mannose-1-phosphate guanylyltransferase
MAIQLDVTPNPYMQSRYWGIILAAGNGDRLKGFIKSEFGKECPKQFCAIIGSRSMLRHTIDRVRPLVYDEHLLTVVNREHLLYAVEDLQDRNPKTVSVIPFNRETAASILLPLLHIHKSDPLATVAIFPSDHFILEEDRFIEHVSVAFEYVNAVKDNIVMLGSTPTDAHKGYGWIKKGGVVHQSGVVNIYDVQQFWEKPDNVQVEKLFAQGCLVNTMILVGKVQTFINIFRDHVPELYGEFLRMKYSLGKQNESEAIWEAFESIPPINFSRVVLERIPRNLCVMPMNDVYWNDWGEEDRIRADLKRFSGASKTISISSYKKAEKNLRQNIELVVA